MSPVLNTLFWIISVIIFFNRLFVAIRISMVTVCFVKRQVKDAFKQIGKEVERV